jgi:putative transposase
VAPFLPVNLSLKKILPLPPENIIANDFYAVPRDGGGTFLAVEPDGSSKTLELPFPLKGDDRVYRFKRATIFAGSSLFESGGRLWWDAVKFADNSDGLYPWDHLMVTHDSKEAIVRDKRSGKKTHHFKRALSLLDSASSHFGHFVIGTLPKMRILRQATRAEPLTLIVDQSMPPRFLESIEHLNPGADVEFLRPGETATVDELIVPETLKYFPDVTLEWVNREIRRRTDVVGAFPNASAEVRLAGSALIARHDEGEAGDQRYFSEASMLELNTMNAPIEVIGGAVTLPELPPA